MSVPYRQNDACRCPRCMAHKLQGPVILVTIGLLFLLANFSDTGFGDTWPVVLIVVGIMMAARGYASTEGHVQAGTPAAPAAPVVDRQVHNG